jgi:hypothetical protein
MSLTDDIIHNNMKESIWNIPDDSQVSAEIEQLHELHAALAHEQVLLAASTRALVLAMTENEANFNEAGLLRMALVRLMYFMDLAREGGKIDLDAFNNFWEQCQSLVRTVKSPPKERNE